jgi:hypothetical protein
MHQRPDKAILPNHLDGACQQKSNALDIDASNAHYFVQSPVKRQVL